MTNRVSLHAEPDELENIVRFLEKMEDAQQLENFLRILQALEDAHHHMTEDGFNQLLDDVLRFLNLQSMLCEENGIPANWG